MASEVVVGIFPNEAAADAAVDALKAWDKIDDAVKLNAIGILALDDKGKIKTQKVGSRSVQKGAGIGTILALLTPVGLVGGIVGGAAVGAFHHKGLGLSGDEQNELAKHLEDGKAAVGVLADDQTAAVIEAKLTELGGVTKSHVITDDAMAEAATVAEAPVE